MDRAGQLKYVREVLRNLGKDELDNLCQRAVNENPWFTTDSVLNSIEGIVYMLEDEKLDKWLNDYDPSRSIKNIGIVMAGNIPMVGFHDLISAFSSGHNVNAKLSSQDTVLMKFIINLLDESGEVIRVQEKLEDFDAVIATGSTNTSRYFEYYFGKYPHIIRKNRSSLGIVKEDITAEQLSALGEDIFSYFGLGCRNVSSIFLPEGFPVQRLAEAWDPFNGIIHHHKYANNYDYNRSVFLVNKEPHFDLGFLMLRESDFPFSPISVLNYQHYHSVTEIDDYIEKNRENIQCVVGTEVDYGQAQRPELWDYADGVDTMKFLQDL